MKCTCGNINNSTIIIFTETTFGHGDSMHKCYVKCQQCGKTSDTAQDWGLCSERAIREAQNNWNTQNI